MLSEFNFGTFDGFKKYCEFKGVRPNTINNPAFEQFYEASGIREMHYDVIDKDFYIVRTDSHVPEKDHRFFISIDNMGSITVEHQLPVTFNNGMREESTTKIEARWGLDNGMVISKSSNIRHVEYQKDVVGKRSRVVSRYDVSGIETGRDYYEGSSLYSYEEYFDKFGRNYPENKMVHDEYLESDLACDIFIRYERQYFDVARCLEVDLKNGKTENMYTMQLSGENGYSRIVSSYDKNSVLNHLDENILVSLTPEEINARLESEANPVVREGLKNKYVNGRSEYSYIPSRDPNLVINGQNLQGVLAGRMVQQMENNTVDAMGNPISQANDMSNNVRTMGFGGMWLIGLITGIMSCGIILLGVFFK